MLEKAALCDALFLSISAILCWPGRHQSLTAALFFLSFLEGGKSDLPGNEALSPLAGQSVLCFQAGVLRLVLFYYSLVGLVLDQKVSRSLCSCRPDLATFSLAWLACVVPMVLTHYLDRYLQSTRRLRREKSPRRTLFLVLFSRSLFCPLLSPSLAFCLGTRPAEHVPDQLACFEMPIVR